MTKIGNKITVNGSLLKNKPITNNQLNVTAAVVLNTVAATNLLKNTIPTNLKVGALYKLIKSNINDINNKELNYTTNKCKDIDKPILPAKIEFVTFRTYDYILHGDCIVNLLKVQTIHDIYFKMSNEPWNFSNGSGPKLEQSKIEIVNACIFQYKESIYISEESIFKDCFELIL